MGIYDREYYRDEKSAGIHISGQWSMVTKLIAINVVIHVLNIFSTDDWLTQQMAASPDSLTNPLRFLQLFTYSFAHDSGIGHIFWNMFGLWIFGRDVEVIYGPREFLRIYLVAAVLGGLVFAARGYFMVQPELWHHVVGASGAITAITLLFCIHFPKRTLLLMLVLPVPAWAIGLMIIVGNLLGLANPGQPVAYDVHLVGAAFAICYYKMHWNIGRWLPSIKVSRRWLKPKPKLKLHDPEKSYRDLDSKADSLLDKVNREGMDSLNARERRTLEEYSRRMQQKHR